MIENTPEGFAAYLRERGATIVEIQPANDDSVVVRAECGDLVGSAAFSGPGGPFLGLGFCSDRSDSWKPIAFVFSLEDLVAGLKLPETDEES